MFESIHKLVQDWIVGPTGFLRQGSTLQMLSTTVMANNEVVLAYRVHRGVATAGTIIAYLDEEHQYRSLMYHGDDGLFVTQCANERENGKRVITYPSKPGKHEMTIHTAKAMGRALGMWCQDQAGQCVDDCVYAEESNVYDALCKEWFGDEGMDNHINEPLYLAMRRAMYETAAK